MPHWEDFKSALIVFLSYFWAFWSLLRVLRFLSAIAIFITPIWYYFRVTIYYFSKVYLIRSMLIEGYDLMHRAYHANERFLMFLFTMKAKWRYCGHLSWKQRHDNTGYAAIFSNNHFTSLKLNFQPRYYYPNAEESDY